ncbi:MAG TPA: hypothetical protein VKV23_00860 [Acidimicrobiales bacterium]|nr:hypothetical protein [Acidimicrobiales bacterium]
MAGWWSVAAHRVLVHLVLLVALAAVAAATATSFAHEVAARPLLYPVAGGDRATSVPAGVTSLVYGRRSSATGKVLGELARWRVAPGRPEPVEHGGDLALVDARHAPGGVDVRVQLVDLGALRRDYQVLRVPLAVSYVARSGDGSAPSARACSRARGCSWEPANGAAAAPRARGACLSLATATTASLELPPGALYEITLRPGGALVERPAERVARPVAPEVFLTAAPPPRPPAPRRSGVPLAEPGALAPGVSR